MKDFTFLVTITATDYDIAREELGGSLEDARDSDIIEDFSIEDVKGGK